MDELMNYASRSRRSGMGAQLYNFLQNLSEVARGQKNVVFAVSIPASELEMTAEDQSDFERFKKVFDRLGKAVVMSSDAEISEIIRRRLFEWDERAVTSEGKVMLPKEALETCGEYADWVIEHRQQLPPQFNVATARETFIASYPFHPGSDFRVRAQMAGIAALSADPRGLAPAGALGVPCLPGRIQGRAQRRHDWTRHRAV